MWSPIKYSKSEKGADLALDVYSLLKENQDPVSTYVLVQTIGGYLELGDKDMARSYLASKNELSLEAKSTALLRYSNDGSRLVENDDSSGFDLIFDGENRHVIEKKKGAVDFRTRFLLLDLLRLLAENQGVVLSKESLVDLIWKQPYNPATHDNKIYVTIRRLRQLIEPNEKKPRYILKAPNGYCMSKLVRIQIKLPEGT